jgi:FlaA1/EpsC-like NDP-sugar epimerase
LDVDLIKQQIENKVVLITGAAGSIGSEMARQIINYSPSKIILLDQAESPLYELEMELTEKFPNSSFDVVIGDIRNRERLANLFRTFKPHLVYHAAAYKHVPMMENNPSESILTNIFGTKNVADLAVEFGVQKFVMVSTDKAVNPTNVMGASKRIAEIYIQSLGKTAQTKFVTTRFGNVLGSNGSVIPRFKKQIEAGGPITITHPEITRFFMTIPEACKLVLEAGTMGSGGEIYIFDMGKPIFIKNLAEKMIRLSGKEPYTDIDIVYTGLRPGEKLYEEVLADTSKTLPTYHPKILIAQDPIFCSEKVDEFLLKLQSSTFDDKHALIEVFTELVPEFIQTPQE